MSPDQLCATRGGQLGMRGVDQHLWVPTRRARPPLPAGPGPARLSSSGRRRGRGRGRGGVGQPQRARRAQGGEHDRDVADRRRDARDLADPGVHQRRRVGAAQVRHERDDQALAVDRQRSVPVAATRRDPASSSPGGTARRPAVLCARAVTRAGSVVHPTREPTPTGNPPRVMCSTAIGRTVVSGVAPGVREQLKLRC
jgi:hypothetical protein